MTTYKNKQYCDAEVGKPGNWHSCKRRAVVGIVTFDRCVIHYCDRHKDRVDDPTRKYHGPHHGAYKL